MGDWADDQRERRVRDGLGRQPSANLAKIAALLRMP